MTAAAVRHVAAARRRRLAPLGVPSRRARSIRRARRDFTVVHVPLSPAGGFPPFPPVSTAVPAATARRLCGAAAAATRGAALAGCSSVAVISVCAVAGADEEAHHEEA